MQDSRLEGTGLGMLLSVPLRPSPSPPSPRASLARQLNRSGFVCFCPSLAEVGEQRLVAWRPVERRQHAGCGIRSASGSRDRRSGAAAERMEFSSARSQHCRVACSLEERGRPCLRGLEDLISQKGSGRVGLAGEVELGGNGGGWWLGEGTAQVCSALYPC